MCANYVYEDHACLRNIISIILLWVISNHTPPPWVHRFKVESTVAGYLKGIQYDKFVTPIPSEKHIDAASKGLIIGTKLKMPETPPEYHRKRY